MSNSYPGRPSLLSQAVPMLVATLVGGGAVLAALVGTGTLAVPWLNRPVATKTAPPPQGTPVLVSARFIPAYTKITRDHVLNEKTNELSVVYLPPEDAKRADFLTLDRILGRVLKGDKAGGYGFREKDFFPPGTLPGPSAGVPPGKRAVVVPADRLTGGSSLKMGDRIDIFMSMPTVPRDKVGEAVPTAPQPGQSAGASKLRRPGVQSLAQDARVVVPVTTRQAPVLTSVTGRDGKFSTRPVEEITIAVDADEAAPLMQALAVDTVLFCALRSGQPGDPAGETPEPPSPPITLEPPAPVQVEIVVGGKRETRVFPTAEKARP